MQGQAFPKQPLAADDATAFGSFLLYPGRHLLLKNDEPVTIGSRALEILIALTERAGELVTKDELTARAWPNATVEESNLRAQIALLRRVLGDDQAAPRYIVAVPSRGLSVHCSSHPLSSLKTSPRQQRPRTTFQDS